MQMIAWLRAVAIGLTLACGTSAAPGLAQSWPQRTVKLIVPLGAGSGTDVAAHLYAERLAERWKYPVIVEDRPGADGLIGVGAFANAHDDHTLLYSFVAPVSVNPLLQDTLPYDPVHDVVPISWAATNYLMIAVNASLKIGSLRELFAQARSQPGKLNYNAGAGAIPYVFAGFLKSAGLDMVMVPYRDQNLVVQDLAVGRIQVLVGGITPLLAPVQLGRARLLAVTNAVRAPLAPDIPTVAEAGYPALTFDAGTGFFGPPRMPSEQRERIAADVRSVAADPALADRLASVGQLARASTPKEFADAVTEERTRMASVMKFIASDPAH
jgi:tripartite-type tricarboxylate transporter receptor subunit TctC